MWGALDHHRLDRRAGARPGGRHRHHRRDGPRGRHARRRSGAGDRRLRRHADDGVRPLPRDHAPRTAVPHRARRAASGFGAAFIRRPGAHWSRFYDWTCDVAPVSTADDRRSGGPRPAGAAEGPSASPTGRRPPDRAPGGPGRGRRSEHAGAATRCPAPRWSRRRCARRLAAIIYRLVVREPKGQVRTVNVDARKPFEN